MHIFFCTYHTSILMEENKKKTPLKASSSQRKIGGKILQNYKVNKHTLIIRKILWDTILLG